MGRSTGTADDLIITDSFREAFSSLSPKHLDPHVLCLVPSFKFLRTETGLEDGQDLPADLPGGGRGWLSRSHPGPAEQVELGVQRGEREFLRCRGVTQPVLRLDSLPRQSLRRGLRACNFLER